MTAPTFAPRSAPAPAPLRTASDEPHQLVPALYRALLPATPKRAATMSKEGKRKYSDAPKGHQFSVDDLRDHLAGRRTWATTLADSAGLATSGCRDYDQGGEAVIVAALDAAHAAGVVAFGIVVEGNEEGGQHSGGHVWALYRSCAPASDIRAQLRALPGARGEIYPSGNPVRLPLGLHRRKGTRGTLLLQDGRRFNLDQPDELLAGLRVILALRRNAAPPAAPPETRSSSGGAFGINRNPADWEGLPDGAVLMASRRFQALFKFRPQLAALQHRQPVALPCDGALDDSGSAQVAVLVKNLLTTCAKGQRPGQGAPPLAEIRAVALHWKPALRDNRTLDHYQAHVDAEIARYTPPDYAPAPTANMPEVAAPVPQPLAASQHRGAGRPAGQRARNCQRLADLVATLPADAEGWRETTRAQLAAALGCRERMVSDYLSDLRGAHLQTRQRQHGIALRLAVNPPPPPTAEACNRPCPDRITTPQIAARFCMESHSAPPEAPRPVSVPPDAPVETQGSADEAPIGDTGGGLCASLSAYPSSSGPTLAAPLPSALAPLSTLRTLVREAFDAVPRLHPNPNTGELGRVTLGRVAAYVEALGVVVERDTLAGLLSEERHRRQLEPLRALGLDGLRGELRKAEAMIARLEKREGNTAYWRLYRDQVRAEMRQRPSAPEPSRKGRKVVEAKPSPRELGAAKQEDLYSYADAALDELRAARSAPEGAGGHGDSVAKNPARGVAPFSSSDHARERLTAPSEVAEMRAPPPTPAYDVGAMIARLNALKDEATSAAA